MGTVLSIKEVRSPPISTVRVVIGSLTVKLGRGWEGCVQTIFFSF